MNVVAGPKGLKVGDELTVKKPHPIPYTTTHNREPRS